MSSDKKITDYFILIFIDHTEYYCPLLHFSQLPLLEFNLFPISFKNNLKLKSLTVLWYYCKSWVYLCL